MSDVTMLAAEEYRALRATIRERGTTRLIVMLITFVTWSAAAIAVDALFTVPAMTLIPLLLLWAGFEAVYAAHVGVERIGRFLYVRYEHSGDADPDRTRPAWEAAIGEVGPKAGGGSDPLGAGLFISATLFNLLLLALLSADLPAVLPGGLSVGFVAFGAAHAVFLTRILNARRFARAQRARDTECFRQYFQTSPPAPPAPRAD